jgi:glucose-1-phosphate thymidylyltransferase
MKGVILAGGVGSRLFPLTKVTNKHLLPVYDRPMIYYPLETLVSAGIRDILIVTGGRSAGDFMSLLADGHDFGLKQLYYAYQREEGGIAQALGLAQEFIGNDKVCVILGDNILGGSIAPAVQAFREQPKGARILLKSVTDPERFGVAQFEGDRIASIVEKPRVAPSSYAVTGVYMYDHTVFDKIARLVPSGRGELEITDVNNAYIQEGTLTHSILDCTWTDAGTFESLAYASRLVEGSRRLDEPGRDAAAAMVRVAGQIQ